MFHNFAENTEKKINIKNSIQTEENKEKKIDDDSEKQTNWFFCLKTLGSRKFLMMNLTFSFLLCGFKYKKKDFFIHL